MTEPRKCMRVERVCSTLVVFVVAACGRSAPRQPQPKADSTYTQTVGQGVRYEYRWYAAGPWAVHSVVVDPQVCGVTIRTMKANDRVVGRQTTLAMAERAAPTGQRRVLAAINADFFSYDPPGVSEGPQMAGGQLIKSEGSHREALEDRVLRRQPVFAFTTDRKRFLTHTQLRAWLYARADSMVLTGFNIRPARTGSFVLNSLYGDSTVADTAAIEIVLRDVQRVGTAGHHGVVTRVDSAPAGVAIPRDGFVIALRGSSKDALRATSVGDTLSFVTAFENLPANTVEIVGGYPMLLAQGKHVHHEEAGLRPLFSDRPHPRSAIAWGKDRHVHLIAVDGRQPGHSVGMSLTELASYLLSRGFTDAMNFDGGGSTSLVVAGRAVNRSSDAAGERAVANALLVLESWPASCSTR